MKRLWLATTALAVSMTGAAYAPSVNAQAVDEIIVTARKVEESLQDIPIAITAFTDRELRRAGIREINEIGAFTPGLNYDNEFGRRFDRPVIRGQSNILGAPNAANFIDGVFIPDSLFSTELANVERVEVIKGPQSALYGRQTFAGAISYITRKPTEEAEGEVRVTVGEDSEFDALVWASGPIVPGQLFGYAAFNRYVYDGQYQSEAPGTPPGLAIGEETTSAATGALRWVPTENFEANLRLSWADNEDGPPPIALQPRSFNNCFLDTSREYFCGEVTTDLPLRSNYSAVEPAGVFRETYRAALTLDYDWNDYTFTSISGWNDSDEQRRFDADFTEVAIFGGSLHREDIVEVESFSQEFRVVSPQDQRIRWLGGLYYFYEERTEGEFQIPFNNQSTLGTVETNNYAVFGRVEGDVTNQLTASVELRAARDELELEALGGIDLSEEYDSLNPRFTLDYQVNEEVLLYGLVARGNKPGGFNPDNRLDPGLRSFDEETAWNYEIGAKTEWLDGRLVANISGYYIDWTNQQLTENFILPDGSSTSFISNAGETEVIGVELELSAQFTENFSVRATYAFNEAEFTEFFDQNQADLTGDPSVAGNLTPNSPQHMATVSPTYEQAVFNGTWTGFIRGDLIYRSTKYAQIHNFAETGDQTLVNLRLGLENDAWSLTAWVKNLFDDDTALGVTRYVDFQFPDFGGIGNPFNRGFLVALPEQRRIGLTASYRF